MTLTAHNSALVQGMRPGRRASGPVRLLRAVCIKGERVEAGELVHADPALASELIGAGKAVRESAAPPAAKAESAKPPTAPADSAAPSTSKAKP